LDIEEDRRGADLEARPGRSPKLVHKVLFSMPPGTPPKKVLEAVKNFAREEFGLRQRYSMVLHTDEPHPHVHMVIKAVSEQGERLNIRKATLRGWRQEFARHLRVLGVPANATERQVRGSCRSPKLDGIYRANLRDDSSYVRERAGRAAVEQRREAARSEAGRFSLMQTRREVERGWHAIADLMEQHGDQVFAGKVRRFVQHLPPVRTDRQWIAERMSAGIARERLPPTR
jgi:MobA/VirD2-like, nuclease domain